jgi:hypothetical protein
VWLYLSAAGGGPWSLDALRERGRHARAGTASSVASSPAVPVRRREEGQG